MFLLARQNRIPCVVLSAGVGEVVEEALRQVQQADATVISNRFLYSKGKSVSVNLPLVTPNTKKAFLKSAFEQKR